MRGIARYNFPAFDAAAALLRSQGWEVVNPAELDRAVGITEHTDPLPPHFLRDAMQRDLSAICGCAAIALLPGWQKSSGVGVELSLARLLSLEIIDATSGLPYSESILEEAARLTRGDRNDDYGHPLDDFERVAALWSVILETRVSAEQIPLCMVGLKISRLMHRQKRDSIVDVAGYADCLQRIVEERGRRRSEGLGIPD